MATVLITGGAGFIGSNLALALLERGHSIKVLDNLSLQIHGDNPYRSSPLFLSVRDKVTFIEGTVNNRDDLMTCLDGCNIVVHLAAETGTGQSMYQIQRYSDINVGGTALLLDILANERHTIEKLVVASSRAVYGEGKYYDRNENRFVYPSSRNLRDMDNGRFDLYDSSGNPLELAPTDEDSKIHPSSVYGITKQVQEQLVMTVCPTIGVAPVAFRYQNVYGPGQSLVNPYTGILSIFSTLIKSGSPINIFEDGLESRDFVFIDDVVWATILGIEKSEANGEVFNVGTGIPKTVIEVAEELVKNYGSDVPVKVSGNYRLGDIRHNYADLKKIRSLLGFSPRVGFEDGIGRFATWVDGQEVRSNRFEASVIEMRKKGLYK